MSLWSQDSADSGSIPYSLAACSGLSIPRPVTSDSTGRLGLTNTIENLSPQCTSTVLRFEVQTITGKLLGRRGGITPNRVGNDTVNDPYFPPHLPCIRSIGMTGIGTQHAVLSPCPSLPPSPCPQVNRWPSLVIAALPRKSQRKSSWRYQPQLELTRHLPPYMSSAHLLALPMLTARGYFSYLHVCESFHFCWSRQVILPSMAELSCHDQNTFDIS